MESQRHSRDLEKDLARDVHKAEWTLKEQKLEDDIRTLRQQLLLLVGVQPPPPPHLPTSLTSRLRPSSRTERGLLPTTGATPCWSRRRWTRR